MPDRPYIPAGWDRVVRATRGAVVGSTVTVTMTVPTDERAPLAIASITVTAPLEPTPPPYPTACSICGGGYQECTDGMFDDPEVGHGTCCRSCASTATHRQDAWEIRYGAHHSRTGDISTRPPGMPAPAGAGA